MTYLYAGLGMALLVAVMAMFQVSNSLLQQRTTDNPSDGTYLGSSLQANDILFLKLSQSLGPTLDCTVIADEIKNNEQFNPISSYAPDLPSQSLHPLLINSCVFNNQVLGHRVLITKPANTGPSGGALRVFSCLLNRSIYCSFESSDF